MSKLLDTLNKEKTYFLIFQAPIKNVVEVSIDKNNVIDAIIDSSMIPYDNFGHISNIKNYNNYRSCEYWNQVSQAVEQEVNSLNAILRNSDLVLSVFPIAPIPLVIKLGYLLSDKRKINIFQKYREPDSWHWQSEELTNCFTTNKSVKGSGNRVALIISISSEIEQSRVTVVEKFDVIYHLKAQKCGVNAIQSIKDLNAFWQKYLSVMDDIKNSHDFDEISLFSAIPVSAAFEIGRRYMPKVYPKIRVYDECNGFFETLMIGDNK